MRTDALARIGNQVFAANTNNDANYAAANAPVRFPQIWNASWFNWVQYNSSIADPLARNIGEALGVRAVAKLSGPDAGKFENSVNIRGLRWIEDVLAGPAPLQGLASPKWPAVFPPLDHAEGRGRRRAVQDALPAVPPAAAAGRRSRSSISLKADPDHAAEVPGGGAPAATGTSR